MVPGSLPSGRLLQIGRARPAGGVNSSWIVHPRLSQSASSGSVSSVVIEYELGISEGGRARSIELLLGTILS